MFSLQPVRYAVTDLLCASLVEQVMPGSRKYLEGHILKTVFYHPVIETLHALAPVSHRVFLTGQQKDGQFLFPTSAGHAGALHGAQKVPEKAGRNIPADQRVCKVQNQFLMSPFAGFRFYGEIIVTNDCNQ